VDGWMVDEGKPHDPVVIAPGQLCESVVEPKLPKG